MCQYAAAFNYSLQKHVKAVHKKIKPNVICVNLSQVGTEVFKDTLNHAVHKSWCIVKRNLLNKLLWKSILSVEFSKALLN